MQMNRMEKMLLKNVDQNEYNVYQCSIHGLFWKRKDKDNKKCPYSGCKGKIIKFMEV